MGLRMQKLFGLLLSILILSAGDAAGYTGEDGQPRQGQANLLPHHEQQIHQQLPFQGQRHFQRLIGDKNSGSQHSWQRH